MTFTDPTGNFDDCWGLPGCGSVATSLTAWTEDSSGGDDSQGKVQPGNDTLGAPGTIGANTTPQGGAPPAKSLAPDNSGGVGAAKIADQATSPPTGAPGAHVDLLDKINSKDLRDWAASYKPAGYNTVVVHGTPSGQFSSNNTVGMQGLTDPTVRGYTAQQLANALENASGWNPDLPTRLVACQAATTGGAQAFANALGHTIEASSYNLVPPVHPQSEGGGAWLGAEPFADLGGGKYAPVEWKSISPTNQ